MYYIGDNDTQKSVTRYIVIINGAFIAWRLQIQKIVTLSVTEAEYSVITEVCFEILFVHAILLFCVCMWIFCPPFSLECPNYEVVGFQPQAVANPEPRLGTYPQIHFNPPYVKVCMPEKIRTKDRQWVQFVLSYQYYFKPNKIWLQWN